MSEYISRDFLNELLKNSQSWVINNVPAIVVTIFIYLLVVWGFRWLLRKVKKLIHSKIKKGSDEGIPPSEEEKRADTLLAILRQVGLIGLTVIFFTILLKKFGVDIGPILASAGIIGLAVGFGAQELVRDIISGFFILLENQIRTNDVAIINGTGGLVEKIELRTITLRDFSGIVHIFQNGKIDTLANMTKEWSAMVFDVGVAYKEKVDEVMSIMTEVGQELQKDPEYASDIIEPIEVFGVDKFADSAVVIKARLKTKPIRQWVIGREYRKRLKDAFDQRNIEIPFPHQTIYWGDNSAPFQMKLQKNEV